MKKLTREEKASKMSDDINRMTEALDSVYREMNLKEMKEQEAWGSPMEHQGEFEYVLYHRFEEGRKFVREGDLLRYKTFSSREAYLEWIEDNDHDPELHRLAKVTTITEWEGE